MSRKTSIVSLRSESDVESDVLDSLAKSVIELPQQPLSCHPKYFIQEEMSTFFVENSLFRVHHYFLIRESEPLRAIISRPRDSEDDPIILSEVTSLQFESLLNFFYNGMHEDFFPTIAEWTALLTISTRFSMSKIRARAIKEIDQYLPPVDPVEKVVLAKDHDIEAWLSPAYVALCERDTPLEVWEAERLGIEITVKLARAREVFRAPLAPPIPPQVALAPASPLPPPSGPPAPSSWNTWVPDPKYSPSPRSVIIPLPGQPSQTMDRTSEVQNIIEDIFWPPSRSPSPPPTPPPVKKTKKRGRRHGVN